MKPILSLLLICVLAHAHTTAAPRIIHPTNPLGVDNAKARLSWRIAGMSPASP
jgi:hypothetical protein